MVRLVAALTLALLACAACAQGQPAAAEWYRAGHVLLGVSGSSLGLSASWQFDQTANGDVRILKEETRKGDRIQGGVYSICNDRALLLKDLAPAQGREMAELDGPVLMLQLTLRLLARALPDGPSSVDGEAAIAASDEVNPIRVRRTPGGSSDFLAPWQARGKAVRVNPGVLKFEIAFSYVRPGPGAQRMEMTLAGLWQQQPRAERFESDSKLDGWRVYRVATVAKMSGGTATVEQLVIPHAGSFQTLGELRARIERDWIAAPEARRVSECPL